MKTFIPTLILALTTECWRAQAVTQGIPQPLLDLFIKLARINISPYILPSQCNEPGGVPKIADISNDDTEMYAWLLRDDTAKQIILSWRGTASITNFVQDFNTTFAPYDILPECTGCEIQGGFYSGWITVYQQTQQLVQQQVDQFPDYELIVTGHSLGGSLAALTAAQFAAVFPNMTVVTMGEPRTGNPAFAAWVDQKYATGSLATTRLYRATHEDDGVPAGGNTVADGYAHHGLEIWQRDPLAANNTFVCAEDEQMLCNEGQGGTGINLAHLTYFGETVVIDTDCDFFGKPKG